MFRDIRSRLLFFFVISRSFWFFSLFSDFFLHYYRCFAQPVVRVCLAAVAGAVTLLIRTQISSRTIIVHGRHGFPRLIIQRRVICIIVRIRRKTTIFPVLRHKETGMNSTNFSIIPRIYRPLRVRDVSKLIFFSSLEFIFFFNSIRKENRLNRSTSDISTCNVLL